MGRTEKFRGSRTHGRGKKAGRGAGKRGGRGNAGLHKHRYITVVKSDPKHFGRHGFTRPKMPREKPPVTINVGQLEERLENYIKKGMAKKTKDRFEVDLSSAKIDKLLGSGKLQTPMRITVNEASSKAKSKVEEAGGEVIISKKEERAGKTQEAE
jgi:large subunit ribosomal protein L15